VLKILAFLTVFVFRDQVLEKVFIYCKVLLLHEIGIDICQFANTILLTVHWILFCIDLRCEVNPWSMMWFIDFWKTCAPMFQILPLGLKPVQ